MALSASRGKRITALTDLTPGRNELDIWYDLTVDIVQEAAHWECCKTRVELASNSRSDFPIQPDSSIYYKYSNELPLNYLRAWYLEDLTKFSVEFDRGIRLLSVTPNPVLVYSRSEPNTLAWPATMVQAVVYALASKIADSITGKTELVERLIGQANALLIEARQTTLEDWGNELYDSVPDWIQARGVSTPTFEPTRFYYPFGEVFQLAN